MGVGREQLRKSVKFAAPDVSESDADAIAAEIMQTYDVTPRTRPPTETAQQAAERGFGKRKLLAEEPMVDPGEANL